MNKRQIKKVAKKLNIPRECLPHTVTYKKAVRLASTQELRG